MYCFFYHLPFNILLTASAKERKKNPDSTLHLPCTGPSQDWASRVYPSPDGEVVRALFLAEQWNHDVIAFSKTVAYSRTGHMTSLGFRHRVRSSSFFGFSVIIASAMERIGVFLVCVMFLGAVSTASVKYSIWNLVLTCRILANLVDLLSTSFQEKLRSELVKACLKWTL